MDLIMVLVQSDDVAELELSGGGAHTKRSKAPTTASTSLLRSENPNRRARPEEIVALRRQRER